MLGLFKKKKEENGESAAPEEEPQQNGENGETTAPKPKTLSTESNIGVIASEIDRLKASFESFSEVRKSMSERMTGLSEQIGELRAMILDRDKSIQIVELKAVKAADLVESVQPDKLMTELQKQEAKFEALKANLEGNEAIMEQIMSEMKEMRKRLDFLRGIEEIIKLSEQVKQELIEIKKVEASVKIESEKVQTIYVEIRKKYQNLEVVDSALQEQKINIDQHTKDIDYLKTKIGELATKEELDRLVQKVQRYIDALKELNKSSTLTKDLTRLKEILDSLK